MVACMNSRGASAILGADRMRDVGEAGSDDSHRTSSDPAAGPASGDLLDEPRGLQRVHTASALQSPFNESEEFRWQALQH